MTSLGELLARCPRVVVAGVGCRGRGDDAFGPVLAARLRATGAPAFDSRSSSSVNARPVPLSGTNSV